MIIKKVGHLVLFKTRLHRLIYRLSFLIMLLSPFLILLFPQLKQEHRSFQEPSLHTNIVKLPTVQQIEVQHSNTTIIHGIIRDECLLVTFGRPTNRTFVTDFIKIVKSYAKSNVLVKSVVILTYDTLEELQFWLTTQKYGIIRAAINLQISQNASLVLYRLYGRNGRQPDQDYYYSVRELLDGLNIRHRPCQAKIQYVRNLLDHLTNLSQLPFSSLTEYVHYQICSAISEKSAHDILMRFGVQSATLDAVRSKKYTNITESLHRLILSWVLQFQVQQDHLHSSNTLYHPFSKKHDLSVKFFMIPHLSFLIALGVYLFTKVIEGGVPSVEAADIVFVAVSLTMCKWLYAFLPLCGLLRKKDKKYKYVLCAVTIMLAVYQMIYYCAWTPFTLACSILVLLDKRLVLAILTSICLLLYWQQGLQSLTWVIEAFHNDNIGLLGLIPLLTSMLN